MERPNCGNKDLPLLQRASDVPREGTNERREAITQLSSTSQQANAGRKSDQGVDKVQIEGIYVIHDCIFFD